MSIIQCHEEHIHFCLLLFICTNLLASFSVCVGLYKLTELNQFRKLIQLDVQETKLCHGANIFHFISYIGTHIHARVCGRMRACFQAFILISNL